MHMQQRTSMSKLRSGCTKQQGRQVRAVLWLCDTAGSEPVKEVGITSGDIFLHMPHPTLKEMRRVVEAGFTEFTHAQLVAASQGSVPGLELWVRASERLGITFSSMPPLAKAVCCGQVEQISTLLKDMKEAEQHQPLADLLPLAVNMEDPGAATALLDALKVGLHDLEPQQMQQLLATAILRGHAALVHRLSSAYDSSSFISNRDTFIADQLIWPVISARITAADVTELMRYALQLGHDSCIAGLCLLSGAHQLDASSVACVVLETLESRAQHGKAPDFGEVVGQQDMKDTQESGKKEEALENNAFWALCSLPGAKLMDWGAVGSLLRIAVQLRESAAVCCLCQLPKALQMDAKSRLTLLRMGMQTGCSQVVQQFLAVADH